MRTIGITGGVGAGKSTVLNYLQEQYHAYLIVADELAKELELPGHDCYARLVETFGERILDSEGFLDKKAFAELIFSDPECLQKANAILHPAVKTEIVRRLEEQRRMGTKLFVLEAALLIEEKYDEILDELWYIYTDDAVRAARLMESRGYSEDKIRSIMRQQLSDEEFRAHCRVVIDNSGRPEDTQKQIDRVLRDI
ncbi:MAG: dephospho-CoA kinase [Lachnospiraceae bacterium]|jgi:dephospho-CoA kinase|nr:dephospho-CoA kinase [Lachnospiraceae bacterium]